MILKNIVLSAVLPLALGAFAFLKYIPPLESLLEIHYHYWWLEACIFLPLLYWIFKQDWQASQGERVQFFGYQIPSFNLYHMIALAIVSLLVSPFLPAYWRSVMHGVVSGPVIEELAARSVILRARSVRQFFVLTVVSASAFSLMHWLYDPQSLPYFFANFTVLTFLDKFFDHFYMGLLTAILAYKTKRLELPIVVHMISNVRYYVSPSIMQPGGVMALVLNSMFQVLLAAGCSSAYAKISCKSPRHT